MFCILLHITPGQYELKMLLYCGCIHDLHAHGASIIIIIIIIIIVIVIVIINHHNHNYHNKY